MAGLVLIGALLLYGLTAAPSLVALFDDSLEFQLVPPTLGIAHPTGYPLYTLAGWLWSRWLFPVGNWAWRMNLFSALAGAGAVALLCLATGRVSRRARLPSPGFAGLLAALALGLSPVWWRQATVAEVYALHGLLVAGLLLASLGIPRAGDEGDPGRLYLGLAALTGLSLAHHRTTVLVLPGLILLLWDRRSPWPARRMWLPMLMALALPLLLYLYIPLRAAMGIGDLNGDYVNSWVGFWRHVLAQGYTTFFHDTGSPDLATLWALIRQQFPVPLQGLALVGTGILLRPRTRSLALGLLAVVALHLVFVAFYGVADPHVFLLPAVLCLALLAGVGGAWLAAWALPYGQPMGRGLQVGLTVALVLLPLASGARPVYGWEAHDWAVAVAKVDYPPQSRVLGIVGEMTALRYMQAWAGVAGRAVPIAADDPEARRGRVAQEVAAGHPVFLTRELSGIEETYSFSAHGPLVRVWPRGRAEPPLPQWDLDVPFADGRLHLVGYDLAIGRRAGGPAAELGLHWLPAVTPERPYKYSLRVVDGQGEPLTWSDGRPVQADPFPLAQVASTTDWLAGERVRDEQVLSLPPEALPGRLVVILYDAQTLVEAGRWQVDLPALE